MRRSFVYDQNDVFAFTTITSREMTSEEKFITDDVSLHRSGTGLDLGSASKQ